MNSDDKMAVVVKPSSKWDNKQWVGVTLGNEIDGRDLRDSIPETAVLPDSIHSMITR